MMFTVECDLIAVSNCALLGTERRSGGRTRDWRELQPIATCLISITCSDCERFTQT